MASSFAVTELDNGGSEETLGGTLEPQRPIQVARGFKRVVYWLMSGFFFVLAMVGVALPGIPTTPFLLLMCYFLIRVSPALHAKALAWPIVGGPLRDWRDHGGVRRKVKILACTMVTLLVGSTLLWSTLAPMLKAVILLTALYGIRVVVRLSEPPLPCPD